jgi:hypothetical protein
MRRALSLPLLLCLVGALAACNQYRNGPEAGVASPAPSQATTQSGTAQSATQSAAPGSAAVYSGTLPFQGTVFNLGCQVDVPVAGSLAVTVTLGDKPTIEAIGSRTFGPPCFNHTDELSHKGKLTKVTEGQYRYQRESKNDTLEMRVTQDPGSGTVTVAYDDAHHCCGKPGEGNEGSLSGSAVLSAVK